MLSTLFIQSSTLFHPGDDIIKIIESTPLDDASEFEIESDFMPIVREVRGSAEQVRSEYIHVVNTCKCMMRDALTLFSLSFCCQVLGKVPNIILEGVRAVDRSTSKNQQKESEAPRSLASASSASASFSQTIGRAGTLSFDRPLSGTAVQPAVPSASSASASFSQTVGRTGVASFDRPSPAFNTVDDPSLPSENNSPEIQVDEATLEAVSRAIMGRLDIVDLIGRNTAYEAAERVRERRLRDMCVS